MILSSCIGKNISSAANTTFQADTCVTTESQTTHHRISRGWQGPLGQSDLTPAPGGTHSRVPSISFWRSARRPRSLLADRAAALPSAQHRSAPGIQRGPPVLQSASTASCPDSGHLWNESSSIPFAPSLRYLWILWDPLSLSAQSPPRNIPRPTSQ